MANEKEDQGACPASPVTALPALRASKPAAFRGVASTGAAGIDPTQADIGRGVVYRGHAGEVEQGYITSFNDHYVFVRYGLGSTSQATLRDQLEWLSA